MNKVVDSASLFTPLNPAAALQSGMGFISGGMKMPWAKNGARHIPKDMPVFLHKGERVLNKTQATSLARHEKAGRVKLPKGADRPQLAVVRPRPSARK